jgi:hypothetical protein
MASKTTDKEEPKKEKDKRMAAKSGSNGQGTVAPVHLMLQSKGGVGKTTCCAFLAQYLIDEGKTIVLLDMDPRNASLSKYKGLPVEQLDVFEEGNIDPMKTNQFFGRLIEQDLDKTVVVDTGATTFEAMVDFLIKQDVVEEFWKAGRPLYLHTVVCSGASSIETLSTFVSLSESVTRRQNLVVWVNEIGEHVQFSGKTLAETKGFQANQERVAATVLIECSDRIAPLAMNAMLKGRMTFKEAKDSKDVQALPFFSRQRLGKMRDEIYGQLRKSSL